MSPLQTVKFWFVDHLGLAKDALHIYVALALFFGSALLFRWRIAEWKPLALVTAVAVVGEVWDVRDSVVYAIPVVPWRNWHDIWNTLFWPAVIVALARWTPVFRR